MAGAVVGAVLIAVVGAYLAQRPDRADLAGSPSFGPSVSPAGTPVTRADPVPIRVGTHVQIETAYSLSADGRRFLLTYALQDQDGSQPRVAAGPQAKNPAFTHLAVAVLPRDAFDPEPGFTDVAGAATTRVTLRKGSPVSLSIAGEMTCRSAVTGSADVTLEVNGSRTVTPLPEFDGSPWTEAVRKTVC